MVEFGSRVDMGGKNDKHKEMILISSRDNLLGERSHSL